MAQIYIVDDHQVMRQSYALLLRRMPGVELCGEAASAEEALPELEALQPDLVLIDISLPGLRGDELLAILQARMPQIGVVIISGHDDEALEKGVLAQGARGYLPKDRLAVELSRAIMTALDGRVYQCER